MARSELATPSRTKEVLAAFGLSTKKSFGQHFLVDDRVVGRILDLAALGPDDVVLEVGPGIGTMTVALCREAGAVVAVERDEAMLAVLEDTARGCLRLAVLHADAVRIGRDELEAPFGPLDIMVSNLPYEVAATVVLRVFEELPSVRSATVMVQAEVADRMAAGPGGKDYGAYTVKLALRASVAGRFAVPRSSFLPPPRVDSAVVRLERVSRRESAETLAAASETARAAFAQRRKTLRNSLASALPAERGAVERALEAAGIDGARRAEALNVEEFVRLASECRKYRLLP